MRGQSTCPEMPRLDATQAYTNAHFIPDAEGYIDHWAEMAQSFREREAALGRARLNHPYGDAPRQKIDMFHPSGPAKGLVVFVHGGYWLRFDRGYWSHSAAGALARDWAVAMPSYTLAPEARIADITREVARAIDVAAGFVRGPLVLTGHSAGGHLVARMGCKDVALAADLRARIAHILPISPVSDLRPLRDTAMNEGLKLGESEAVAESPVCHPRPDIPVTVWVGAEERPVFLDQARWLAEAWGAPLRAAPGRHHFDVIDDLEDPDAPLMRALLDGIETA